MDSKRKKLLLYLIDTFVNTKYGYATILSIDDDDIIQVRLDKKVPMFLNIDELLLTEDDYKRASLLRKLENFSLQRKEINKKHRELTLEKVQLEGKLDALHNSLKSIEVQSIKLKEALFSFSLANQCYKEGNNKIYYRVLNNDFVSLVVDRSREKRPSIKKVKLDFSVYQSLIEINPEEFEAMKDETMKELGL